MAIPEENKWKIWYADGSTFSDQDGLPQDAPKTGAVLIIVQDGRFGKRKMFQDDYYVWSPTMEMWTMQRDAAGVIMRGVVEPWIVLVSGFYMREDEFEKIMIAADADDYITFKKDAPPPHPAWRN